MSETEETGKTAENATPPVIDTGVVKGAIQEILADKGREPMNVQVVLQKSGTGTTLVLRDVDGEFLEAKPAEQEEEEEEGSEEEGGSDGGSRDEANLQEALRVKSGTFWLGRRPEILTQQ